MTGVARAALGLVVIAAAGCGANFRYTATQTPAPKPKPADCELVVADVLDHPKRYEKIGVLEDPRWLTPHTLDEFKRMIHAEVCRAGGDAVVGDIDSEGVYLRGVVYKRRR